MGTEDEELTIDYVMTQRFELSEQIAIIEGRHNEELAPLKDAVTAAEQFIKQQMLDGNQQSFKSAGTGHMAYFTEKTSCKISDWDLALAYIKQEDAYHLLNQAVNKTAVKEHIEVKKAPPPGVEFSSFRDLSWKRGKGGTE